MSLNAIQDYMQEGALADGVYLVGRDDADDQERTVEISAGSVLTNGTRFTIEVFFSEHYIHRRMNKP